MADPEQDMMDELRELFADPAPPHAKTAAQVAEALGLSTNSVSKKLAELCKAGTWTRHMRGDVFVYWKLN